MGIMNEAEAKEKLDRMERRKALAELIAPERRLLAFTATNRANHSYSLLIRLPKSPNDRQD